MKSVENRSTFWRYFDVCSFFAIFFSDEISCGKVSNCHRSSEREMRDANQYANSYDALCEVVDFYDA